MRALSPSLARRSPRAADPPAGRRGRRAGGLDRASRCTRGGVTGRAGPPTAGPVPGEAAADTTGPGGRYRAVRGTHGSAPVPFCYGVEVGTSAQALSPNGFRCSDLGRGGEGSERFKPLCPNGCAVVPTFRV